MSQSEPANDGNQAELKAMAEQIASSHELLKKLADKGGGKDAWDKLSAITGVISSVLLAAVGMYVSHLYRLRDEASAAEKAKADALHEKQRQEDQARFDHHAAEMAERELVVNLMPFLTGENQQAKKGALLLLNGLGNTELMAQLAKLDDTQGSREALLQVAYAPETSSENKAVAKEALAPLESRSLEWFLSSFGSEIDKVFGKTVFPKKLVAAIAYQETGYIWSSAVARGLDRDAMLALCAGDTMDAPFRSAWPKNRAQLLEDPKGTELFSMARGALEAAAKVNSSYHSVVRNPDKFCHAFGPFAYDLQYYRSDPDFFLTSGWRDFNQCATRLLRELQGALHRQNWSKKTSLSEEELVHVAIAYNRGRSDPSQGFKQGIRGLDGKYYGERIHELLRLAGQIPQQAP